MKKVKFLFFLLSLCMILLSCTDKKPVSQVQESSVQQEDSVPVKKVDSVKVAKKQPLTYKILVPFAYRFCNPDTLINKNWVELYKDGKDYYVGKACYSIQKKEDLYEPLMEDFIKTIKNLDDTCASAALFSHNPTISEFGSILAGEPVDFPTCGVALFELETDSWADYQNHTIKLKEFILPKDFR